MKPMILLALFFVLQMIGAPFSFGQRDKDAQKSAREANRAYKDKDYYTAIIAACDAFQGSLNKKGLKDMGQVLADSYRLYLPGTLDRVKRHESERSGSYSGKASVEEARYVVQAYEKMIDIQQAVKMLSPGVLSDAGIQAVDLGDYGEMLERARHWYDVFAGQYAKECYENGQAELAKGTKGGALRAYHLFAEAKQVDKNFKDISDEIRQAHQSAQYRIAYVEFGTKFTMPVTSFFSSNGLSVSSSAAEFVAKNPYPNFVAIVRHEETFDLWLNAGNVQAIHDFCVAKGFDGVVFGSYEIPSGSSVNLPVDKKEIEKEVVVGETRTKGSDGKEVVQQQKQKVKGVLHSYVREHRGDVTGQVFFYDAVQGKYVLNRFVVKGETFHRESWERGTGDLRVFSEREQKRFREKDPAPTPPGDMQIGAISNFGSRVYVKFLETLPSLYE